MTRPGHGVEDGIHDQLGAQGARAELGPGEVQVVLPLEAVVGELVPHGHAEATRPALGVDEIDAGDLGLFAAVLGVGRHEERLAVGAQDRARALVEPLGGDADAAGLGSAALQPPAEHPHAVGQLLVGGRCASPGGLCALPR